LTAYGLEVHEKRHAIRKAIDRADDDLPGLPPHVARHRSPMKRRGSGTTASHSSAPYVVSPCRVSVQLGGDSLVTFCSALYDCEACDLVCDKIRDVRG
jgi:hypothetical protein